MPIDRCHCGFDLASAVGAPATDDELKAAQWLESSIVNSDSNPCPINEELRPLLNERIEKAIFFGKLCPQDPDGNFVTSDKGVENLSKTFTRGLQRMQSPYQSIITFLSSCWDIRGQSHSRSEVYGSRIVDFLEAGGKWCSALRKILGDHWRNCLKSVCKIGSFLRNGLRSDVDMLCLSYEEAEDLTQFSNWDFDIKPTKPKILRICLSNKTVLTKRDAANYLNISQSMLKRLVLSGAVRTCWKYKHNSPVFFYRKYLDQLIQKIKNNSLTGDFDPNLYISVNQESIEQGINVSSIFKMIIEGVLEYHIDPKINSLLGAKVKRGQVRKRFMRDNDLMDSSMVAAVFFTNNLAVAELCKAGFLISTSVNRIRFFRKQDVEAMQLEYISAREIANGTRVAVRRVTGSLQRFNVCKNKTATQVYRRSEVAGWLPEIATVTCCALSSGLANS